jgi:GABA permease
MISPNSMDSSSQLAQGFKPRHVTMLSIAGIIGAGLFVGSGHAIAAAGPAVLLAYLFSGLLVVLVMRMLGEMAVANPDTGSFSTYADQAIGRWAGFTIGWLYWWFWVLVIPIEALAAGHVLNQWFPQVDAWLFALGSIIALVVTNLFSVSKYGEFEFWFAMAKVVAIIGFIGVGFAVLMGWAPDHQVSGLSGLMAEHGGFAPNGLSAVVGAFITIMFSFIGTEAVTIAAAESSNPAQNIAKATRSVIWRIGVFYLLSIFVVISVVPWNDPLLASAGSYQRALEIMNIPNAKFMVDIVVLIAVASCMNSSIYIASRMLYSLGRRGDAPKALKATSSAGVPQAAVIASTVLGASITVWSYFMPAGLFEFLLASFRRDCLAGLPRHRGVAVAHAPDIASAQCRADLSHVAVSLADVAGDRVHLRSAGSHDDHPGAPHRSHHNHWPGAGDFVDRLADVAPTCASGTGNVGGIGVCAKAATPSRKPAE